MIKNFKFHAIALALITLIVLGLSQAMAPTPNQADTAAAASGHAVQIVSASWGLNCNPSIAETMAQRERTAPARDAQGNIIAQPALALVSSNNVLPTLQGLCDGKPRCTILANNEVLKLDPLTSCFKKLAVSYRCFTTDRLHATEVGQSENLDIDCIQKTARDASAPAAVQP